MGDFNGDGIPDLAVTDSSGFIYSPGGPVPLSAAVKILLGKGDGTFTTSSTPNLGVIISPVVVGDFNGDGIPDLAVHSCGELGECGNGEPDSVIVLLGNGDGTFTTQFTTFTSNLHSPTQCIAAGDFNGDGSPDLVLGTATGYLVATATVLLNQITTESATATLSGVSVFGTTHLVEASYPGDTNYSSSISNGVTLLAAKVATTLNLSSSPNPSPYTGQITLTATLSPYFAGGTTTDGETVNFYNGATSIGTGTLSSGVATLNMASPPVGTYRLTAAYPGDGNFLAAASNSLRQTVNPFLEPSSGFVVTVNTDDATGVAVNCATTDSSNCSLRDALAAAAAAGGGKITFAPTVSGIGLGFGAGLYIPANTTIIGPAGGLSVGGLVEFEAIFNVNPGVVNSAISNLSIGGNDTTTNGGGIYNGGQLTVTDSSIGGNNGDPFNGANGSGIFNDTSGVMTLINGYVSGNELSGPGTGTAGGIYNGGTMMVINSTIANNDVSCGGLFGVGGGCINFAGGIYNGGTLILTGSTIQGNDVYFSGDGGGILNGGILVATNTNVTGNIYDGASPPNETGEDDCDGGGCLVNGVNGNTVGAPQPTQPAAATPAFDPPAGIYDASQPVTITDTTPGAIIFYSTDAERTWTRYSAPIPLNSTETLQAIAAAPGYTESPVASIGYKAVAPLIGGISPNYGAPAALINISGTNFGTVQGRGSVTIGGAPSYIVSWSDTAIQIQVPSRATTGNLVVTAGGGASNGAAFTFYPYPAVTGFSPASAAVGSPVTINGTGILDGGGNGRVSFNGIPAAILSQTSTEHSGQRSSGCDTGARQSPRQWRHRRGPHQLRRYRDSDPGNHRHQPQLRRTGGAYRHRWHELRRHPGHWRRHRWRRAVPHSLVVEHPDCHPGAE